LGHLTSSGGVAILKVEVKAMFSDSVPFTVAGVFFLMLVAIWSIDMIQNPDPRPVGETECFVGGGTAFPPFTPKPQS
jgi:hypothetical protein